MAESNDEPMQDVKGGGIVGGENQTDEVADAATEGDDETVPSILEQLRSAPPPEALPLGWVRRESHSHPNCVYYYHQDSGDCRWEAPHVPRPLSAGGGGGASSILKKEAEAASSASGGGGATAEVQPTAPATKPAAVRGILKKSAEPAPVAKKLSGRDSSSAHAGGAKEPSISPPARKKSRVSTEESGTPREVRVLHLLKKHRGSRRPASWRKPKITDSKEKAIADLKELISILKESESDPKELRATFEELARTESDCSSAKRGGDLGFFGRKKMQPAFEKASFGLKVGQLSGIVETSSGVHVILRLA